MAYTEQEVVNLFYADIIYDQTNYTAQKNKFITDDGRTYTVQGSRNNVYKIHAVIDGQYVAVKVKDTDGAIRKKLAGFKGQVFPRQTSGAVSDAAALYYFDLDILRGAYNKTSAGAYESTRGTGRSYTVVKMGKMGTGAARQTYYRIYMSINSGVTPCNNNRVYGAGSMVYTDAADTHGILAAFLSGKTTSCVAAGKPPSPTGAPGRKPAPPPPAVQAPAAATGYFSAGPAPEVYEQTPSGLVYNDDGVEVPVREGKYGMEEDPYRISYAQQEEKQPLAVRYDREKEEWVAVETGQASAKKPVKQPAEASVAPQPKPAPSAKPNRKALTLAQECYEVMTGKENRKIDLADRTTLQIYRTNTIGGGNMIITVIAQTPGGKTQKIKYEIDVNSSEDGSIITKTYYNDAAGTKALKKEKVLYSGDKAEIM